LPGKEHQNATGQNLPSTFVLPRRRTSG
jgi:hypothetical protein